MLIVLAISLSGFASAASATPTVTFKARFVPIEGSIATGNALGAGAAIETELGIKGTEYGGYPPPVIGISVIAPQGTELNAQGFPTCPVGTLVEEKGPDMCPRGSSAGPVGHASGFVVFGTERVPETVSIESFYAPGGGLNTYIAGHTPATIELVSVPKGPFINPEGTGAAARLDFEVPLVEIVPGSAYASFATITRTIGSAYTLEGHTRYYVKEPGTCPKGGFPYRAELTFAAVSGLPQQTVVASDSAPCPTRASVPETPVPGTGGVVTVPPNHACNSHRSFTIHVAQIKGVVYRRATIYVNGRRVKTLRGSRISVPVDLRGLPKGRYTVKIVVTTDTGRRITVTRTYHTCTAKPPLGKHHRP
ncbi:MAG TPA: hypothetical protein VFY36_08930 [Solirubrobacteraceae bacterium]|nr:hypothetical protein [Solirubrobacteraceae bacterium]